MERKSDLEGDGISEDFFNYLWMKDELGFGPSVNVPDTIVYKYGQPIVWYFTSSSTGKVKKKNKANLISGKIEDAFTRNVSGYDILATFVSAPPAEGSGSFEDEVGVGASNKKMEFLDRQGFHDFLYNRFDQSNGILQKFIEPKGNKNEMIRAIWSPKVCLLERSVNRLYLHDTGYGLYERCLTYEGPEAYSTSVPLRGPVLAGHCQKLTETIAQHISEVTFSQFQIARLVLNFKVDSRDKLWVLYSSSVRCLAPPGMADSDPNPTRALLNIENTISIPDQIHLNPEKSYDGPAVRKQKIRCISCAVDCIQDLRHPITYKSVIKHYEHVLQLVIEMLGNRTAESRTSKQVLKWPPEQDIIEAAGGVGFGCLALVSPDDPLMSNTKFDLSKPLDQDELRIPPIIRYLHPKLTAKSFERCRKDPLFLYKTVSVCENCYLVYAEFATMLLRIGQDLTKLLRPDPAGVIAIKNASLRRPTSAEWRSVSTVQKGGSPVRASVGKSGMFSLSEHDSQYDNRSGYEKSANHIQAKVNAIGLRSSDARVQPDIPGVVRNAEESRSVYGSLDGGVSGGLQGSKILGSAFPDYNHSNIPDNPDSIAARERVFYKEVSRNPQIHDQHPLMHLVNAQQKLALIDEQSGVFSLSADTLHSDSLFGSSYGSTERHKFGTYMSKLKDPRKKKVPAPNTRLVSISNKNRSNDAATETIGGMRASKSSEGRIGTEHGKLVNPSQSSTSHTVFLRETLKKVEEGSSTHAGEEDTTPVEPTLRNFKKGNSHKKLPELEREVSFKEEA